jgi:hypothetical protein
MLSGSTWETNPISHIPTKAHSLYLSRRVFCKERTYNLHIARVPIGVPLCYVASCMVRAKPKVVL